jgi:hypothetical protein
MPPHYDTPKKSKILGGAEFAHFLEEKYGQKFKRIVGDLEECFGTGSGQVSRILKANEPRRTRGENETRGGYRGDEVLQFGEEQARVAADVIEENGYEGHNLDYGSLRHEAQLPDVTDRTIRDGLSRFEDIGRFIARTEDELDDKHAAIRVSFAEEGLRLRPKPAD